MPTSIRRTRHVPRSCSDTGPGRGDGNDLVAATAAALAADVTVALVEQPYRVAGRRSPAPRRSSTPLGPQSSSSSAPAR